MRSLHHPWTLGLATGKTSRESFMKYVAQDAYFLRAFAKAYAYALTKAEDEESVRAFHSLIGSVLEELSLHSSFSAKWGVDLKNVSEKPTCTVPSRRLLIHVPPRAGTCSAAMWLVFVRVFGIFRIYVLARACLSGSRFIPFSNFWHISSCQPEPPTGWSNYRVRELPVDRGVGPDIFSRTSSGRDGTVHAAVRFSRKGALNQYCCGKQGKPYLFSIFRSSSRRHFKQ